MVFRRRHNYGIDIFTPYVLNYIIIIFILHLNRFLCTLLMCGCKMKKIQETDEEKSIFLFCKLFYPPFYA